MGHQIAALVIMTIAVLPGRALAHGETARGGGGGGINAVGATMSTGVLSAGLRLELREFGQFADQQLLDFAAMGEDVHQHSRELSGFLYGSYTIDEQWSLHANLGANAFMNFREGSLDGMGMPFVNTDSFSGGLGDLVLLTRFRPWNDGLHHIALIGAVKLPTGMTQETDDRGERIGAHNQPGTGSIDFQLGLAYSLTYDWFQLDADVIGHIRTEGATSFQSGNMLQADVALSASVWQLTFVAELNLLVSERDVERDEILRNSGIATLYVSPGVIVRLTDEHMLMGSVSVPIWQGLPGIQNPELVRGSIAYAMAFDLVEPDHAHRHVHDGGVGPPHHHPHEHRGSHDHPHETPDGHPDEVAPDGHSALSDADQHDGAIPLEEGPGDDLHDETDAAQGQAIPASP